MDMKCMRKADPNLDLSGKCGSCGWGTPCRWTPKGDLSYTRCENPEKKFRTDFGRIRQRSTKACLKYKPKEVAEE